MASALWTPHQTPSPGRIVTFTAVGPVNYNKPSPPNQRARLLKNPIPNTKTPPVQPRRLPQAVAEIKDIVKVGVYICATKDFIRQTSSKDPTSMVSFERTKWYLENFRQVLTVPILLVGLNAQPRYPPCITGPGKLIRQE